MLLKRKKPLKEFVQQLDLAQNQLPAEPAVPWTLAPSEAPSSGLDLLWKCSLHYGFRMSCRTGPSQLITLYLLEHTLHSIYLTQASGRFPVLYGNPHVWNYHCYSFQSSLLRWTANQSVCSHLVFLWKQGYFTAWNTGRSQTLPEREFYSSWEKDGEIRVSAVWFWYRAAGCLGRARKFTETPPGITCCLLIKNPVAYCAALES